jgi:hypothetical protein
MAEVHLIPAEDLKKELRSVLYETDAISWVCRLQDDNSAAIASDGFCSVMMQG